MDPNAPAVTRRSARRHIATIGLAAVLSISSAVTNQVVASPLSQGPSASLALAQNVDYISAGEGESLDLGFPVLVPSWVPAPFGGAPAISANGGSYSLYWMNGGGEPTFLQVQGVVGGGLPAGSPYDLNIELTINASVNGIGAIHDVTPIYDAVWWVQGGVLYSVQSRNMTGTDSLSLAQSLVEFVPPAAPEPTAPPPPSSAPPVVEDNEEPEADQGGADPETDTPDVEGDGPTETVTNTVADEEPVSAQGNEPAEPESTGQDADESVTEQESAPVASDGTGMPSVASDGTGGPPVEVVETDGTGGRDVIVIPRRTPVLGPTP